MIGLSLRNRVRSSDVQKDLRVQLLLFCIQRGQLRWFRHLIRILLGTSGKRFAWNIQLADKNGWMENAPHSKSKETK